MRPLKKKKRLFRKKIKGLRGGVNIYLQILIFISFAGGMLFSGGIIIHPPPKNPIRVALVLTSPQPAKNALQLYTFGQITPSPTPYPTVVLKPSGNGSTGGGSGPYCA